MTHAGKVSVTESDERDPHVPELDQHQLQNSMMDKALLKMVKKPPVQASLLEHSHSQVISKTDCRMKLASLEEAVDEPFAASESSIRSEPSLGELLQEAEAPQMKNCTSDVD